jgi:hypothetical protein
MGCRGVLFAVSEETVRALLGASSDDEVMAIVEAVEEAWDREHLCETDKAWDAMHRALSDGSLDPTAGEYPLNRAILGGKHLHHGDDYIVALVRKNEVPEVAAALAKIDEAAFRDRYLRIVPKDYAPEYGEQDLAYTWANVQDVTAFYARASSDGLAVVFTVDQ